MPKHPQNPCLSLPSQEDGTSASAFTLDLQPPKPQGMNSSPSLYCFVIFFFFLQQLSRLCWLQALSRAHPHQASVPPDPGFLAGLRGCCPLRPRLPRTFLLLHSATVSATLLFSKQECNTNVTRSSTPFHWETGPRRWPQEPPQKDSLGPSVSA